MQINHYDDYKQKKKTFLKIKKLLEKKIYFKNCNSYILLVGM